jgi:hypothetical protein
VRPVLPKVGTGYFALTIGHRLTTSSLLAGTLNSAAAFSIAVCSSGASTMPSHAARMQMTLVGLFRKQRLMTWLAKKLLLPLPRPPHAALYRAGSMKGRKTRAVGMSGDRSMIWVNDKVPYFGDVNHPLGLRLGRLAVDIHSRFRCSLQPEFRWIGLVAREFHHDGESADELSCHLGELDFHLCVGLGPGLCPLRGEQPVLGSRGRAGPIVM